MPLLLEEDYEYLDEIGQQHEEDESRRFLVLRAFRLPQGLYVSEGGPAETADVLFEIPSNYNLSGSDMFWVSPFLTLASGAAIPAANRGADPRHFGGRDLERWSRHWGHLGWRPRIDNMQTLIDRLTWALANPDPQAK